MKSLVLCRTKTPPARPGAQGIETWELVAFGDSPIMHAIWNPYTQQLVVQFASVYQGYQPFEDKDKKGKSTYSYRKSDQYYRVQVMDEDAVKFILENYVANFDSKFDWRVQPPLEKNEMLDPSSFIQEEELQ